jgi:hypothetical protein
MQVETLNINDLTDDQINQLEALLADRKQREADEQRQKRESYELLREDTINDLVADAIGINDLMSRFKVKAFNDLNSLYNLLQEYGDLPAENKGNFSLENSNNTYRVAYSRQQNGKFDERSQMAEKHIMLFVNKQFAGDDATRKLITTLLERKKGQLDINLVQKLYKMEADYTDENWLKGITLLKESWIVTDSKDYVRFYKKEGGEWKLINLNIASISNQAA